jgi:hypothetical protein
VADLAALSLRIETTGAEQAKAALQGLNTAGQQTTAVLSGTSNQMTRLQQTTTRSADAFAESVPRLGRMERAIGSLALSSVGLEGPLARVGEILATMALGGPEFIAVAAGLAAIAYAIQKIGEAANKSKTELDNMKKNLDTVIQGPDEITQTANALNQWREKLTGVREESERLHTVITNIGESGLEVPQRITDASEEADRQLHIVIGRIQVLQAQLDRLKNTGGAIHLPAIEVSEPANLTADELSKKFASKFADAKPEFIKVGQDLGQTLGDAMTAGFTQAFKTGSLTAALEAMGGTLLQGLGSILKKIGEAWVAAGIATSVPLISGPLAIAAGLGLIAAGSALEGLGSSALSSLGASSTAATAGASGSSSVNRTSSPADVTTTVLHPVTGRGMANAQPMSPLNVWLIGTDDPTAQRQLIEMINKGQRRGLSVQTV